MININGGWGQIEVTVTAIFGVLGTVVVQHHVRRFNHLISGILCSWLKGHHNKRTASAQKTW